jgi:hypothetical protein
LQYKSSVTGFPKRAQKQIGWSLFIKHQHRAGNLRELYRSTISGLRSGLPRKFRGPAALLMHSFTLLCVAFGSGNHAGRAETFIGERNDREIPRLAY